jgi:hypothetical protein
VSVAMIRAAWRTPPNCLERNVKLATRTPAQSCSRQRWPRSTAECASQESRAARAGKGSVAAQGIRAEGVRVLSLIVLHDLAGLIALSLNDGRRQ